MSLKPQSVRAALNDHLTGAEAIKVVGQMMRGYPNRAGAGDSYIGALAEILQHYPRCVASLAGDLVKGVPAETRFLPTPADVIAWCEREVVPLRKIVQRDDDQQALAKRTAAAAEADRKAADARAVRPTYDELRAKYGPTWGIAAAADDAASQNRRAIAQAKLAEANRIMLMREYAAAGVELTEAAPGIPISITLRRILAEQKAKAADEPD
jgi:hypothetical protein